MVLDSSPVIIVAPSIVVLRLEAPSRLTRRPVARARGLHRGRSWTARQRMRIGISPRAAVNEVGCCNRAPHELKRTAPLECFFIQPRQSSLPVEDLPREVQVVNKRSVQCSDDSAMVIPTCSSHWPRIRRIPAHHLPSDRRRCKVCSAHQHKSSPASSSVARASRCTRRI